MKKWYSLLALGTAAALVASCGESPTATTSRHLVPGAASVTDEVPAAGITVVYSGQGETDGKFDTQICNPSDPSGLVGIAYIHWIFTAGGTSATITIPGVGTVPMFHMGGDNGAAWHYFQTTNVPSDLSSLISNVSANAPDGGATNAQLTISHGCPGGGSANAVLAVTKDIAPHFKRTYKWLIEKTVDNANPAAIPVSAGGKYTASYGVTVKQNGFEDSDFSIDGNITVSNPNTVAASITGVTDAGVTISSCSIGGTATDPATPSVAHPISLPAGSSLVCQYSASLTSGAAGTNTATVSGIVPGVTTTSFQSNTVLYAFTGTPTSTVNKTVNITDTFGGAAGPLGTLTYNESLTPIPAVAQKYTYTRDLSTDVDACGTTSYPNTATITETGQSDSKSVSVTVNCLSISKTAAPSFTRTYKWTIAKAIDKDAVSVPLTQGSYTANYTVTVKQNGFDDSDWRLSGNITVANAANAPAANITSVVDNLTNASITSCSIGGSATGIPTVASPVTLAGGASLVCAYSTATSLTSGASGNNTATVSATGYSALTSAGVPFAFTTPTTTVNKTVNITDAFNGGLPGPLGSVTYDESKASGSTAATYTYPRTVTLSSGTCGSKSYNNTAKITETRQSDGKNLTVTTQCGCTPGYWKSNTPWTTAYGTVAPIAPTSAEWTTDVFGPGANSAPWTTAFGTSYYTLTGRSGGANLGAQTILTALGYSPATSDLTGKGQILLRAASAALLNASWQGSGAYSGKSFGYPMDGATIRSKVLTALATPGSASDGYKNLTDLATKLDGYNNLGCAIDSHGVWIGK